MAKIVVMTRALVLLFVLAQAIAVGQPAPTALAAPVARLAEEFGRINSVRELADGRVLITDNSSASRLVVANLTTGTVTEIGRAGNGPREYQHPLGRLIPLAGDSTLVTSGQRPPRWVIMSGAEIVESVPMDSRPFLAASDAVGADAAGNVLANRVNGTMKHDGPYTLTKYAAVLANRRTGRVDTVATMRGSEMSNRRVGTAEKPFWISTQANFSVSEQSMLFLDGWIATVRVEPYRVDWRSPDGKSTPGQDLDWKPVKVDDREKKAYDARVRKRTGTAYDHSRDPWAAAVSPIRPSPLIAAPDGNVWIFRSQWSGDESVRYDVVDRRGRLLGRVRLADNQRVVGFGKDAIYVAVVDDDGIERLQKHPWPATVKLSG
jgi:hypothetical protein